MPSIADMLTNMPEAMYPRWFEGEDRIQYMPAEGRYAILLQIKLGHWCGYVHVPSREAVLHLEGKLVRGVYPLNWIPRVSYSGPGSRQISWRWYNSNQQLKTQAVINQAGDWWVGFDTLDHPMYRVEFPREYLIHFEHAIHETLHDDSTDPR